jgi:3-hydroxyacyl-[acyl-carrier-protein] dehydratase
VPHSVERVFAADHPTAAGHFPGNPIIPGALLLSEIVQAIAEAEGRPFAEFAIPAAKFLRPVRPGDRVLFRWRPLEGGGTGFECLLLPQNLPALTGTVRCSGQTR